MPHLRGHETKHDITVLAAPQLVFDLLADMASWPVIFPPTVHVQYLERDDADERVQIWATANSEVKTWTSRRHVDREGLRIAFQQEVSQPPVAAMGGEWVVEPLSAQESLVRLTHDFQPVDDRPESLEWIRRAVDRNSEAELGALKAWAEQGEQPDQLLSFEDVVRVDGSVEDAYDFLYRARDWPEHLPHVARAELKEDVPGIQLLDMDTRSRDGTTHTTSSVRICFPPRRIIYKQTRVPALLTAHTGQWRIDDGDGKVKIVSTHTVVLNPSAVRSILGAGVSTGDARSLVRTALGENSTTTMRRAADYARRRQARAVRPGRSGRSVSARR